MHAIFITGDEAILSQTLQIASPDRNRIVMTAE